jgi:deoxyribonuclease-4
MIEPLFLGSHLSLSSPSYYLGAASKAVAFGENCFMFYTGAPQNGIRLDTSKMKIAEGRAYLKSHHIQENKIVVHAPYIINLANLANLETRQYGEDFLIKELKRVEDFGLSLLVLHPGSALSFPREEAIKSLSNELNKVLEKSDNKVTICLETMAGKGSEIGSSFEELKAIRDGVNKKEQIGFCLDTCHLSDEGWDINNIDAVLSSFDSLLGLENLKVIHLNDSKNPRGSHKDRHENIGYGTLGFACLEKWVKDKRLSSIPKILETPMIAADVYPYAKEIEMLRSGIYESSWREKLVL